MQPEKHLFDKVELYVGDCLEIMSSLEAESVDACITDPPYHLASVVKRFGKPGSAEAKDYTGEKPNATGAFARASRGFMGKEWDGGDIAFRPETWAEIMRVLKPGGHLLAFGAPKNFGLMQVAMIEAGFEIRDVICWLFGTGFPKSHDVGKGIDAKIIAGSARTEEIRKLAMGDAYEPSERGRQNYDHGGGSAMNGATGHYEPRTPEAAEWQGWGTALKPAFEPIILARKPMSEKTVASNVLTWRTGAINIDACKIGTEQRTYDLKGGENLNRIAREHGNDAPEARGLGAYGVGAKQVSIGSVTVTGRHPANVAHDGSDEVVAAFPQSKGQQGRLTGAEPSECHSGVYSGPRKRLPFEKRADDSGSAARFFYSAKANKTDRALSKHPTVKPVALMQWLVRMVTPKGGVVIDPFAGTGTTGEAAWREGFNAILIEREQEYLDDIRRRMQMAEMGPEERERFVAKMTTVNDNNEGTLFQEVA